MYKKTIERIAAFALAAFLTGYLAYQVVYGSNESSYKYGYNWVKDYLTEDRCLGNAIEEGGCGILNIPMSQCEFTNSISNNTQLTNATACVDGFINGWKDWCNKNAKDCVQLVTGKGEGYLPGMLYNGTTVPYWHYDGEFLTGTWDFVNETSGTSGKITFYASSDGLTDFSKVVGGKTTPGHIPTIYGHQLMYCENYFQSHIPYPKGCTLMTFTIKNPDHIELTNSTYGDTIHLMR